MGTKLNFSGSPDDEPLAFGKYKGLKPRHLADRDPNYIVWIREQHSEGDVLVSDELYEACRAEVEADQTDTDEGVKATDTFMKDIYDCRTMQD